ncbi:SET domain-containing protein, partial [Vibrio cholerae]|uniref:SET domain-containing protein n=1 Tax=Vibrio cholerae TaxID=666 RepID=UPI0018F0A594|nr:SET domain-containing protein-lysine N-methyltransferase [Vibrio cholerae]
MANDCYPIGKPNNCEFVVDYTRDKVQQKPRVYLRALRDIEAGEELTASYGRTYWEFHESAVVP